MVHLAQNVASSSVQQHETFGFGEPILRAQLAPHLPAAVRIPPVPELFVNGLRPFFADAPLTDVPAGSWLDKNLLAASGDVGLLQLAPLTLDEHDVAMTRGG